MPPLPPAPPPPPPQPPPMPPKPPSYRLVMVQGRLEQPPRRQPPQRTPPPRPSQRHRHRDIPQLQRLPPLQPLAPQQLREQALPCLLVRCSSHATSAVARFRHGSRPTRTHAQPLPLPPFLLYSPNHPSPPQGGAAQYSNQRRRRRGQSRPDTFDNTQPTTKRRRERHHAKLSDDAAIYFGVGPCHAAVQPSEVHQQDQDGVMQASRRTPSPPTIPLHTHKHAQTRTRPHTHAQPLPLPPFLLYSPNHPPPPPQAEATVDPSPTLSHQTPSVRGFASSAIAIPTRRPVPSRPLNQESPRRLIWTPRTRPTATTRTRPTATRTARTTSNCGCE